MAKFVGAFAAGVVLERGGFVQRAQIEADPYWQEFVKPRLTAFTNEASGRVQAFVQDKVPEDVQKSVLAFTLPIYEAVKDLARGAVASVSLPQPVAAPQLPTPTVTVISVPVVTETPVLLEVTQRAVFTPRKSRHGGTLVLLCIAVAGVVVVRKVGLVRLKKTGKEAYVGASAKIQKTMDSLREQSEGTPAEYVFKAGDAVAAQLRQIVKDVRESPEFNAVCDTVKSIAQHPKVKEVVSISWACSARSVQVAQEAATTLANGPAVKQALEAVGQAMPVTQARVVELERNVSDLQDKVEKLVASSSLPSSPKGGPQSSSSERSSSADLLSASDYAIVPPSEQ